MKPQELRIGNTVKLNFEGEEFIINVTSVDSIYNSIWGTVEDGNTIGGSVEKIEGIPLTEEWLKNELPSVEVEGYPIYVLGNGISMEFYTDAIVLLVRYEGEIKLDHIKYVHQLQNLYYSLSGEELILNV